MENKQNLLISFSGGRTSAFMTKYILDNWSNMYNIIVVFANTGKEFEQTLEFVNNCDVIWNFNTIWLEAVTDNRYGYGVRAKVVNYNSASRNGEPFENMIKKHGLPNVKMPFCSRELKNYCIKSYAKSIGFNKYKIAIGIRSDEIDRINKDPKFIYPLVNLGSTKESINKFWSQNNFTLNLKGYEGNCDFCFKKSLRKLLTLVIEYPSKLDWWQDMELKYSDFIPITRKSQNKKTTFFRSNTTSKDLLSLSKNNFEHAKDDSIYLNNQLSLFDLDISNGCVDSCEVF